MPIVRTFVALSICASALHVAAPARAEVPAWADQAVDWAAANGYLRRRTFKPNAPLTRTRFAAWMERAFDGGYAARDGYVLAGEVDRALVRALGKAGIARRLSAIKSPDGWDPRMSRRDGFEVVAREMGLRHDRPTSEEAHDAYAWQAMPQADVVYALWRAKNGPSTYGADALAGFAIPNYSGRLREVVRFAFDQIGQPYVWAGEWSRATPAGYPYGTQTHGGFDCSGFVWYVMKARSSSYSPPNRPYRGWGLAQRSSSDMAGSTSDRLRYRALSPGDLMFFAPDGADARAAAVYHAGIYLGNGWMVHSSGSRAGPSLAAVGAGSWWRSQFAWGRRLIR